MKSTLDVPPQNVISKDNASPKLILMTLEASGVTGIIASITQLLQQNLGK